MSAWLAHYPSRWRSLTRMRSRMPGNLVFWLRDANSLTQHLKALSHGQFQVDLLSYQQARPMRDERCILGLSECGNAFIRQVRLLCAGQAVVFARTVIPAETLTGKYRLLAKLGTRPLGELLFSDKSMRRGEVEVAGFPVGEEMFRGIEFDGREDTKMIWGRRSVFYLQDRPLLVSEFFLPRILDFKMQAVE